MAYRNRLEIDDFMLLTVTDTTLLLLQDDAAPGGYYFDSYFINLTRGQEQKLI